MSVQKFLGTIETDGVKDERGIETPSLSATGEVSGKTGDFSESVTAPVFNGKATRAIADGNGNNIPNTYATQVALSEEASARQNADTTLSGQITDIVDGTTPVAQATNATNAANATNATNADHADTADTATNANNATNATNATNVTTNINGKAISSIFESNGTTVKLATKAVNASNASTADKLESSGVSMNPTLSNGIINIDLPSTQGVYLVNIFCSITVSSQTYACYGSALLNVQALGVGMSLVPVLDDGALVGFLGLSDFLKSKSPGLAFYNTAFQKQTISEVTLLAITQQAITTT